jgi:hypothetical protein
MLHLFAGLRYRRTGPDGFLVHLKHLMVNPAMDHNPDTAIAHRKGLRPDRSGLGVPETGGVGNVGDVVF